MYIVTTSTFELVEHYIDNNHMCMIIWKAICFVFRISCVLFLNNFNQDSMQLLDVTICYYRNSFASINIKPHPTLTMTLP